MYKVGLLVFVILLSVLLNVNCDTVIRIKNGLVRGFTKTAYYGRKYTSFEGIRYGQPPEKELRYRDPLPAKNWTGTFVANETILCAQYYPYEKTILGQEDCLAANVYTPRVNITGSENMDVIVFVASRGYAFLALYYPDILMERDVIFVSLSYRVGFLGFMNFGGKYVSGNYGLKDQSLLLSWLKDNIRYFGGNPNSITLMGLGGGAGSVQHHYVSPLSKGLFHKSVVVSGSFLNTFAFRRDTTRGLSDYLRRMGCTQRTSEEKLDCLQKADLNKTLMNSYTVDYEHFPTISTLTVEPNYKGAFLLDEPEKLLKEGKINQAPQLNLASLNEGTVASGFTYNEIDKLNSEYKEQFPIHFEYSDDETRDVTSEKVKNYVGTITKENYQNYTDLLSIKRIVDGMQRSAKYFARFLKGHCYYGLVSYVGENSMVGSLSKEYHSFGADHGDTIPFFVTRPEFKRLNKEDSRMSKVLVDTLVEFMKSGNAYIKGKRWTHVSKTDNNILEYLHIKSPDKFVVQSKNVKDDRQILIDLSLTYQP